MNIQSNLVKLSTSIVNGQSGNSRMWQGADVVITTESPAIAKGGFYPEPRYVVTAYASDLSWLFEQIRDIFMEIDDYGNLKEEIFGRLGNTANRVLSKNPDANLARYRT